MSDVVDHIANLRYLMGEAGKQIQKVHELSELDLDDETIRLNVTDIEDQMKIIMQEIVDLRGVLDKELEG